MKSFDVGFCGEPFLIWKGQFWGRCFEELVILWPSYVILGILSAFYIGYQGYSVSRCCRYLFYIKIRIIITAILFICALLNVIGSCAISGAQFSAIDYITNLTMALSWLLHIGYLVKLKSGLSDNCRGPFKMLVSFVVCLTSSIMSLIGLVLQDSLVSSNSLLKICCASLTVSMQVAYCLTLLPEGKDEDLNSYRNEWRWNGAVQAAEEETPLFDYLGDEDEFFDAETLTQSAECVNLFSKVFFWWLNPLITKGVETGLREIKDLFALPSALQASSLFAKVSSLLLLKPPEAVTNPTRYWNTEDAEFTNPHHPRYDEDYQELSLFSCLFKSFGWEYIAIGILKLLSDSLAFSGPLLLNVIVSYLENNEGSKQEYSYWYAFALFVATSLGALITVHYNFQVGRIALKIRGATIIALYTKILALSKIKLSAYNSGQIMNFMSTDSDRIVNFCESFHQFWSLPVQIIIIFYLLYRQVGFSFVVGIIFAVVVILFNHYIAKKIVSYSRLMMEAKDKRIKVMSEITRGIRSIKVHAWEERFMEKVEEYRKVEVLFLKKRKYLDALCVYLWATTPLVVAFLTFTTFVLLGNTLSASKIFTSIALFNMLIVPLNSFPWVLNGLMEAWVSLKRIQQFFQVPSLFPIEYYAVPRGEGSEVSITEGIFGYGRQENFVEVDGGSANNGVAAFQKKPFFLGSLNIQISKGQLVCVIGKVGSGKSTLLQSILGDVVHHRGTVGLCEIAIVEGIGFVPQEPWIQRGSIRDNILFGRAYVATNYEAVIEACGLICDLQAFRHGDKTEVGENGFTLSGGQRARIALARAVYQFADVYLIDDPFASVDEDMGKLIFEKCILGLLKNKTVVISTHHTEFAAKADYVIHLGDGKILSKGSPQNVLKPETSTNQVYRRNAQPSLENQLQESVKSVTTTEVSSQLVKDEERSCGVVEFKVYKSYWNAVGTKLAVFVLICCLLMQSFRTLADWWLSYWVSRSNGTVVNVNASVHNARAVSIEDKSDGVTFYLYVYGGLVAFNSLFSLARAYSFAYAGIVAAVNLQKKLLRKIMMVSLSFFDATPMGRILNRFSSDVYNADDSLPFQLNILLSQLFSLGGCLAVTCYGMSWVACIFIPLLLFYYRTQKMYRCTSRELKRLSSVTLSPMYAHFTESVNGHSVIRALRRTSRFSRESMKKLDENNMALYAALGAVQWLNLRLQFIGVTVVTGIAVTALLQNEYGVVDAGLVGLTLSYALSLQSLLNGSISAYTETEKEMISVERILQYAEDLSPEDGEKRIEPHHDWPAAGAVTFGNVYLQYGPERFPVVEAATFSLRPGEKVGIIGRTGSGKTTLVMALLRMVNIVRGNIYIDGLDISNFNLKALRSRLSVIPQDPFLFEGTIRENLDPQSCATDEAIMIALDKCYMLHKVIELGGLAGHVGEGGKNFSTGEKQLLCLARALLRKSKVVCMDEATASIDMETDDLVQKTIRVAFASTTVLVIAHRLTTVQHCDLIMVMKNGKVSSIMRPKEFFTTKHGEDSFNCLSNEPF